MYTTEELLKMLREGKDTESLMDELTKNLNAAQKQYDAEEAEKRRKAEREKAHKEEDIDDWLCMTEEILETYYPKLYKYIEKDYDSFHDIDTWIKAFDDIADSFTAVDSLINSLKSFNEALENNNNNSSKKKITATTTISSDTVNDFLKTLGLL